MFKPIKIDLPETEDKTEKTGGFFCDQHPTLKRDVREINKSTDKLLGLYQGIHDYIIKKDVENGNTEKEIMDIRERKKKLEDRVSSLEVKIEKKADKEYINGLFEEFKQDIRDDLGAVVSSFKWYVGALIAALVLIFTIIKIF